MFWDIIFVAIGLSGTYFLYRLMRKEAIEGKCSACSSSKNCKSKNCNEDSKV